MKNIISLSGGKDSTAMLLECLRRGVKIDHCVFFDTGWEFPGMTEHIDLLEKNTGVPIVRLNPEKSFEYWMFERKIIAKKGKMKGKVHRIGNGWPSPMRRWCTRIKANAIDKYFKSVGFDKINVMIGFAADERKRENSFNIQTRKYKTSFPLIEWGINERAALHLCISEGYTWEGLYNVFSRVSCFCCPLQRIGYLRKLREFFLELWARMLEMDSRTPGHNQGFRDYDTVHDLEQRFANEDLQQEFDFKQ